MYFWNIESLKNQIRSGPLPQRETLQYLSIYVGFMLLSFLPNLPRKIGGWQEMLAYLPNAAVWAWGILGAYRANGGDGGTDFVPRFLALVWVNSIRGICKIVLPVFAVLILLVKPLLVRWALNYPEFVLRNQSELMTTSTFVGSLIGIIIGIAIFRQLHEHFGSLARDAANNPLDR